MKRIVFYSWQSDLDGKGNRNLIQDALIRALKAIKKDDSETLEPVLDRDTSGLLGSPSISESIFNKISLSDVFIADVSIINSGYSGKKTSNPNVLIELGYAVSQLGWDRVIMIQNTFYGYPEELPFDLRGRRVITYSMNPDEGSKAESKNLLQGRIESALKESLNESSSVGLMSGDNAPIWWGVWNSENNQRSYGGNIFIRETSSNGFLYDLNVYNGSHSGSITGEAVYVSRDTAYSRIKKPNEEGFGELRFRRSIFDGKRFLKVEETASCQHWRGMGVTFNEEFRCAEDHLFSFGFVNEMELQRLHQIMGKHYFDFKSVMEGIGERDCLDTFPARTYHGGIRGLYTTMEGMLMIGRMGEVWVIYLLDNKVRYFTNVLRWKKSLPKTFEVWRERFLELSVIYGGEVDNDSEIDD